jgi:hypothetical protein
VKGLFGLVELSVAEHQARLLEFAFEAMAETTVNSDGMIMGCSARDPV